MALPRYDTRLASEEEFLPQIRSDWESIVDPFEKQREAENLLGLGYTPESLIGQFNQQFGGGATLDDLNFLLNYGKPVAPLSSVTTDYYGDPDTSVGPLTQVSSQEVVSQPTDMGASSVADALGMNVADVNALLTDSADLAAEAPTNVVETSTNVDTSNVLDTIGATFDQDALNRLTASVDPEAIAADLEPKIEAAQQDYVTDFQGNEYSGSEILNLAKQISGSLDVSKIGGAVYGTQGSSIGFDFEMAKKILGRDPTAADQVLLDMARNLRSKGITDLSQIKVEDVTSTIETSVYTDPETGEKFLVDTDGNKIRSLTPEEISNLKTKEVDAGDGTYTQEVLDQEVTTKQTVGPDGKPIYLYGEDGGNVFGETYTGEGATDYVMEIDPETGLPKFYTTGRSTSDMEKIQMALTFASFIPGVAPFVQAVQGAYAVSQGDPLAAAAAFAGAGGYTDAARILAAANAAKNGDLVSAAFSLAGTSYGQDVLKTDLGGGFTVNDVVTAAKIVSGIDQGNYGMALSAAGDLMKSSDLKAAAAGLNVYNAITSGNPVAMLNALDDAKKVVEYIGGNTAAKDTISTQAPAGGDLGSGLKIPGTIDTGPSLTAGYGLTLEDERNLALGTPEGESARFKLFMQGQDMGLRGDDLLNYVNSRSQAIIASASPGAKLDSFDASSSIDLGLGSDAYTYARNKGATEADAINFAGLVMSGQQTIPTELTLNANDQKAADQLKRDQEKIDSQKTYNDAFKTARELLGPGMRFTWKGGTFVTDTAEENPALAQASNLKILEKLMSGDAVELEKEVKSAPATYSGPTIFGRPVGTAQDAVNSMLRAGTVVKDFSVGLGEGFGNFMTQLGDLAFMMTAKQGEPVYDDAGNLMGYQQVFDPVVAKDNILSQYGNQLSDYYAAGTSQKSKDQWDQFVKDVKEAPIWMKPLVSLTSGLENFGGVMSKVGTETGEEIAPLLTGFSLAKSLGMGTSGTANLTATVATLGDMAETGSGSFNTVYDALKNRTDMTEEEKFFTASQAASNAMLATAVFGHISNDYLVKSLMGAQLTPAATKIFGPSAVEYVTEKAESKLQSLSDTAAIKGGYDKLTQADYDNSETDSTISALLGAKTAGTITGTATVISHINNEMVGAKPGESFGVLFVRNENGETALVPAGEFKVGDKINLNEVNQIQDTADLVSQFNFDTSRAEDIIGNVNNLQYFKDERTSDPAEDAAFSNIINLTMKESGVDPGKVDITIKPDQKSTTGVETVTDPKSGVTTETVTNPDTGVTSSSTVDPTTNQTTNVTVDPNNDSATASTIDPNTGTKSDVTVDTKNNVATTSTVDPTTNQKTDVTIDANNDTVAQTTIDPNTNQQTNVTIDAKTNVITESTSNPDTNLTINTTIDPNNNSQTSNVVNPDSTSTITINNNENTATNQTIDTKNNVETNTTIDLNTNQVTTITTNLTTNQTTTTTKPVDEVPITTLVTTLNPAEDPTKTTKPPTKTPRGGYDMPLALGAAMATNPELFVGFGDLFTKGTAKFKSPLDDFLSQVDENYAERAAQERAQEQARIEEEIKMQKYFTYGQESKIDDVLEEPKTEPAEDPLGDLLESLGLGERKAKSGGLMTPLMAKGGNPPAVHYAGKPRIDFRKGAHVAGPGDGQSDDIPAMLADGEFVFPADVVAALGNGSTKAGSDKLYEMMHEIRRRYRSAKPKDLPPPAKSPLEYLSKKGRR